MTTVIFQRYISPQHNEGGKCWYYKYESDTFGPFLTKKHAEDHLQLRIMKYKNQGIQSEISIVAIMTGFQPVDKGSTPLFRSEDLSRFFGEVVITLACHARVRSSILLRTATLTPNLRYQNKQNKYKINYTQQ